MPTFPLGVPAAGICPIEPGCVTAPGRVGVFVELLLLPLLLQAARAVMLATARARTPICLFRSLVLAPFLALWRRPCVLGSSAAVLLSQFAGDPLRHGRGAVGRKPLDTGTARLTDATRSAPVVAANELPGRLAVLDLAEAQVPSCIDLLAKKSQLAINPVAAGTRQSATDRTFSNPDTLDNFRFSWVRRPRAR